MSVSERIRHAVILEQKYFAGDTKSTPPSNYIAHLQLRYDRGGDLLFTFSTVKKERYLLRVVLKDEENLGWEECRALCHAMRIAKRGTPMNSRTFDASMKKLAEIYGRITGPQVVSNIRTGAVHPGNAGFRANSPDTIISTTLAFDDDGDVVLRSHTKVGATYVIYMILKLRGSAFTVLDCDAFVDCMQILETGDVLSSDAFFAHALSLHEKYKHIQVRASPGSKNYLVSMTPTAADIRYPVPDLVVRAVMRMALRGTSKNNSAQLSSSRLRCPYPGITYTRALKESGQAQVYEGLKGMEKVAVKVYSDAAEYDSYKTELMMFLKMSPHPNVVGVLDFFDKPKPAIVMEFVEGDDLMDYLENHPRVEPKEGLWLVLGIAEGLCHLHKNLIIHRDMKSPNILRRKDGTPILIDLGLGAVIRPKHRSQGLVTNLGTLMVTELATRLASTYISDTTSVGKGTLFWMAPEMISKKGWSDRIDVYAFGMIMWEVFSGLKPFVSDIDSSVTVEELKDMIVRGKRPSLSHVSHIDQGLQNIIQRCWHPDPKQRPTMMEVIAELREFDPELLFKHYAGAESGSLGFLEFGKFLQKYAPKVKDPEDILMLFKKTDRENSGSIRFGEFQEFWSEFQSRDCVGGLR